MFASVNTCNGSFESCLKLLKQYHMIEQMCSDAHSITLTNTTNILFIEIVQGGMGWLWGRKEANILSTFLGHK